MEKLHYIEECHKHKSFIFKSIEQEMRNLAQLNLGISFFKKRNDLTEV